VEQYCSEIGRDDGYIQYVLTSFLFCKLKNNFDGLKCHHVLRGRNEVADELAKLGSCQATLPPRVFLQELHKLQ
jgi:hypothetical protein